MGLEIPIAYFNLFFWFTLCLFIFNRYWFWFETVQWSSLCDFHSHCIISSYLLCGRKICMITLCYTFSFIFICWPSWFMVLPVTCQLIYRDPRKLNEPMHMHMCIFCKDGLIISFVSLMSTGNDNTHTCNMQKQQMWTTSITLMQHLLHFPTYELTSQFFSVVAHHI